MKKPGAAPLRALPAFAAAFAAGSPAPRLGFVRDDHLMTAQDPRIRTWSAENPRSRFRGDPFGQGLNRCRPRQTVSSALDLRLRKLNPSG